MNIMELIGNQGNELIFDQHGCRGGGGNRANQGAGWRPPPLDFINFVILSYILQGVPINIWEFSDEFDIDLFK